MQARGACAAIPGGQRPALPATSSRAHLPCVGCPMYSLKQAQRWPAGLLAARSSGMRRDAATPWARGYRRSSDESLSKAVGGNAHDQIRIDSSTSDMEERSQRFHHVRRLSLAPVRGVSSRHISRSPGKGHHRAARSSSSGLIPPTSHASESGADGRHMLCTSDQLLLRTFTRRPPRHSPGLSSIVVCATPSSLDHVFLTPGVF